MGYRDRWGSQFSHRILKALGVPVIDLAQDGTHYFDYHHTANDTLDKVEPAALEQAAVAFASAAYILADSSLELGRIPAEKPGRDDTMVGWAAPTGG